MNRACADGSALTLTLSPWERERLRNRPEYSERSFAKRRVEWSSLSLGERAGVRADQFLGQVHGYKAFCFY